MKFPKPAFDDVLLHYKKSPESVHECPRIYRKDPITQLPGVNTCAIRMSEALLLANRLIESRTAITDLTNRGGTGKSFLLGKYGYKANLCPHGTGRGALDLAYFLQDQWGTPNGSYRNQDPARSEGMGNVTTTPNMEWVKEKLASQSGIIAFIKIHLYNGQGHIDAWNRGQAVGHAYWKCDKIMFWKLD
jgi:hypothetical protein